MRISFVGHARGSVSIVVPVFNGGPAFDDCLGALMALKPPPVDLIIVDDHSTDRSAEAAEARGLSEDHAMLAGLLAAENVMGPRHDLWQVNTERSYYEELRVPKGSLEAIPVT